MVMITRNMFVAAALYMADHEQQLLACMMQSAVTWLILGSFQIILGSNVGNSISVHRGFAHDPLRIGRNLVGR